MSIYHLHKWSVSVSLWEAPEVKMPCLAGYRDGDDKPVVTTAIVKAEGRTITTASGSVYILEDIDPEYLNWMTTNGLTYNPENPFTFKKP